MSVTKEMIFAVANQIVADGQKATVANVREKIGKGSYAAYIEPMREWRGGQKLAEAPAREAAPQTIRDRIQMLGDEVWELAVGLANESLKREREALEETKIGMDEELRDAVAFADQIVNELEQLRTRNEELKGLLEVEKVAHEKTKGMYQAEVDQKIRLKAELEAARERNSELKEDNLKNQKSLEQAHIERERLLEIDKKQNSDIAKLEVTLEEVRKNNKRDLENAASDFNKLKEEKEQTIQDNKKVNEDLRLETIKTAKLESELSMLNKQLLQQASLLDKLMPAQSKTEN